MGRISASSATEMETYYYNDYGQLENLDNHHPQQQQQQQQQQNHIDALTTGGEETFKYYFDDTDYGGDYPDMYPDDSNSIIDNNNINGTPLYYYDDDPALDGLAGSSPSPDPASFLHYVGPALLVLICLVGFVGNALVIFVILRQRWTKKVTYLYLCNLAVVNQVYIVTTVPISTAYYVVSDWPLGSVMCKVHGYMTSVCLSLSVLTLTATGIDRYLAVLHPVRSRSFRTDVKARWVIGAIWLASFVLMSPRLKLYDTLHFDFDGYAICSRMVSTQQARRLDSLLLLVTMYLVPLAVLTFCHLKIALLLWKSRRPGGRDAGVPPASQDLSVTSLRERRRVAKIVFALTVAFGVGWLPLHVVSVYEDFTSQLLFNNREAIVLGFSFGANSINPFLYCLLSKQFRKHFWGALVFWKGRRGGGGGLGGGGGGGGGGGEGGVDTANNDITTPIVPLQRQAAAAVVVDAAKRGPDGDEVVVICLENDAEEDNIDDVNNSCSDTSIANVAAKASLLMSTATTTTTTTATDKRGGGGGGGGRGCGGRAVSNIYVKNLPTAARCTDSTYIEVSSPSTCCQDSSHHDDHHDHQTTSTSGVCGGGGKLSVDPVKNDSIRPLVDPSSSQPLIRKTLVSFGPDASSKSLPLID